MTESEAKIHVLDAAYKPFPMFEEWAARTSIDSVRWDRYNAALKSRSDSSTEALRKAREIVKRAAALDTGAIEGLYEVDRGFTFTVALETAAWEVELAKKGENVRPLFEAQMQAYDYVLDLATKVEPISEAAIRVLHEVVCRAQATYRVMTAIGPQEQELVKGRYKVLPNHVRTRDGEDHSYAPVDMTPAEMERLVKEMRSGKFLTAHPVIQAAYAHYGLVVVHPFADGNGRVARALASAFTYRAISMPIMILSEYKSAYLDALESADRGGHQEFVSFMLARSVDTMSLVEESLRAAQAPDAQELLEALNGPVIEKGEFSARQIDEAGVRLLKIIESEARKEIFKVAVGKIQGNVKNALGERRATLPLYRTGPQLEIEVRSIQPSRLPDVFMPAAVIRRTYDLFMPKDAVRDDEYQLRQRGGTDFFAVQVADVVPEISGVVHLRVELFAQRVVVGALSDLKEEVDRLNK